jgi:hypothetical protein
MRVHRRAAVGKTVLALLVAVIVIVASAGFLALSRQPGAAPTPSGGPYAVTFEQIGACSPQFWGAPWSVTIGGVTKVEPPSTALPLDNYSLAGTTNSSLSQITFSLDDGTYNYSVSPSADFFTPDSGSVAVSGSNVTVRIAYTGTSCITTTSRSTSVSTSGEAYLNTPPTYAALGYPMVTYSSYSSYSPDKPNFTLEYQTTGASFQVGSVGGDVIPFAQAVGIGAGKAGLNPSNYSLAEADFEPGVIVNSTLAIHPEWILFFAQVYHGYWLWGDVGNSAVSVQVDVDALSGNATVSTGYYANGATPPSAIGPTLPTSGQFALNVNSSQALAAVRGSDLQGVPPALPDGTVTSSSPRVVLFGLTADNEAFMSPVNSTFDGHYALCWVITMFSPTPGAGYQGTFAVDAQTGQLVSGWAQELFPNTQIETVSASLDFSSPTNLTVSQETFQINGSVIGRPGTLPVTVPNVLIIRPGSSSEIGVNFSSSFPDRTMNLSLQSFSNPLPAFQSLSADGLPQGVSARFLTPSVAVPANGTGVAVISISANETATPGTYLLKLNASWSSPAGGQSSVLFLLTVWNGTSTWPQPPTVS